jgi:hypothetical protein
MKQILRTVRLHIYAVVVLAVAVVPLLPILTQSAAAAQVTTRSIQMSSSVPSATNVTYAVKFTLATTSPPNIQGIVLDFCDNDPLVGDTTCTTPAGFSLTASPTVNNLSTGSCVLTAFTTVTTANSNRTLEFYDNAGAVAETSGGVCTFNVTTVTNPSTANHSFYARVYTMDTTTHTTGYAAGTATGSVDSGGFALSTASQITISATVQETLTFCVSGALPGAGCSGTSTPALTIGHGAPPVITASAVDQAPAYAQTTTNANGGIAVDMKASNTCANGGLSSTGGTVCNIPGAGSSAVALVAGTAKFGMCVNTATTSSAASIDANYNDSVHNCPSTWVSGVLMGMDGTNLTGTFGDEIYTYGGPVLNDSITMEFGATASTVTPAGIYAGKEALIATGIF